MIGAWRWPRFLWPLRRQRRPIVRLWDREFNYVATIADGGREAWRAYVRRLGLALIGRRPPLRRVENDLDHGGVVTIDL